MRRSRGSAPASAACRRSRTTGTRRPRTSSSRSSRSTGRGNRQPPEQPKIPLAVALNARDSGQIPAANPLTAAAGPLLILLGRLRLMIIDVEARPLMEHVANEISAFEQRAIQAGVEKHDVDVGKYVLAGTADDIVQNLPGADKGVWLQYSMVAQFFGRRTSGVGFYDELAKVLQAPGARYNLLELMHACLSLGFEGQYRGSANGANELARIRRTVYETLRHLQQRSDEDISPRWRGLELKMRDMTSRIPMWADRRRGGGGSARRLLCAPHSSRQQCRPARRPARRAPPDLGDHARAHRFPAGADPDPQGRDPARAHPRARSRPRSRRAVSRRTSSAT